MAERPRRDFTLLVVVLAVVAGVVLLQVISGWHPGEPTDTAGVEGGEHETTEGDVTPEGPVQESASDESKVRPSCPPDEEPQPDAIGGYVGTGLDPATCTWAPGSVPLDAPVVLERLGPNGYISTTLTGADGCYLFAVAAPGTWRISVMQPPVCDSDLTPDGVITVTLTAPGTTSWPNAFGY